MPCGSADAYGGGRSHTLASPPAVCQTTLVGRPADYPAFCAERLAEIFAGEVGLKPPDVPKAMSLAQAELVETPSEMYELARAGWVPSTAAAFMSMSLMGRHRLEQWVQSVRADFASRRRGNDDGGRDRGYSSGRPVPKWAARPKWAASPRREPLHEPAQALADDPAVPLTLSEMGWADSGDGEARVRFTYALRIVIALQNFACVAV